MQHDPKTATSRNLEAALNLASLGIPCFPCRPDKGALVKWKQEATAQIEKIESWWRTFPNAIPAFPAGEKSGISVIDLDVKNGKNGVAEYARLGFDLEDAGVLVQTASGGYHLYFEHMGGVRNSQDKIAPGIDVRGEGGYVIAPGAIVEDDVYRLVSGEIDIMKMIGPAFPLTLIQGARSRRHDCETGDDIDQVRSALGYIDSHCSHDHWVHILMALNHFTGGSSEGLELALQWSSSYPGFDPEEVKEKWWSFDPKKSDGITAATIFTQARRNGWNGGFVSSGSYAGPDDLPPAIKELNERFALVRMGAKVAIAEFKASGDIDFISTGAFRELFANRKFGKRTLGAAWMHHPSRRTFEGGVVFRPDNDAPPEALNLWTGWAVDPDPDANCDLVLRHIRDVLASGKETHADYIFSWLAHMVQTPEKKPDVALILKGKKGAGKDSLAEIMKRIVGRRHCAHVPATERLVGRFNAAFATAILIHAEEAIWGGQKESKGVVQSLITCPEMPLERKGIDTVQVDSFCRLLFTTNEAWAVPATADERRYAVFEVSNAHSGDREYFNKLWDQVENGGCAGFLAYLLNWQQPDHVELRNPPKTRGLMEQKLSGLRGVERWWYEVLSVGEAPGLKSEFEDFNWMDSSVSMRRDDLRQHYENWMRDRRYQGEITGPSEFGEALRALCPGLTSSRPSKNGARIWNYVLPPLQDCRSGFLKAMGGDEDEIQWGAE